MTGELGPVLGATRLYAWAVFLAFWGRMGWTDWFYQKIRNRQVLWLAGLGLAAWLVLGAHTAVGWRGHVQVFLVGRYYGAVGIYWSFSVAAAYALWALRVWPAGDVKLYVALALLFPLLAPGGGLRSGLRFLEVLINTFLPAAACLFVLAAGHVFRTRLAHQRSFLAGLGLRRQAAYFWERSREAGRKAAADGLAQLESVARNPRRFAITAVEWLATMALMSVVSYWLRDIVRSPFLKSVLFFALFFLWSRVHSGIGRSGALAVVAAAFATLYYRGGTEWGVLLEHLGNISAFSLAITLGMAWAVQLLAGQWALFFYPLMTLAGALLYSLLRALGEGVAQAWAWVPPAWIVWIGMGLFLGLALVFVRIWDRESFESVPADQVRPFMTLGPALLERLAEDEELFEEHFSDLYADGLTPAQVDALRGWCAQNGVARVPLAPTISFGSWIFLGYFLTWLLDGNVLAALLRR